MVAASFTGVPRFGRAEENKYVAMLTWAPAECGTEKADNFKEVSTGTNDLELSFSTLVTRVGFCKPSARITQGALRNVDRLMMVKLSASKNFVMPQSCSRWCWGPIIQLKLWA